jgi:hypothetical protein
MQRLLFVALAVLGTNGAASAQTTPQKPIDKGPYTPAANSAYQGGGVVLQGAPGAPAPKPEPTPSGQAPANMVPAK